MAINADAGGDKIGRCERCDMRVRAGRKLCDACKRVVARAESGSESEGRPPLSARTLAIGGACVAAIGAAAFFTFGRPDPHEGRSPAPGSGASSSPQGTAPSSAELHSTIARLRALEGAGRVADVSVASACGRRMAEADRELRGVIARMDRYPQVGAPGLIKSAATSLLFCTNCAEDSKRRISCDDALVQLADAEQALAAMP